MTCTQEQCKAHTFLPDIQIFSKKQAFIDTAIDINNIRFRFLFYALCSVQEFNEYHPKYSIRLVRDKAPVTLH